MGFRLRKTNETKSYLLEETKHNYFVSSKHEKICKTLNYVERILILTSAFTGCILVSAFRSLVGIILQITSSAIRLKICVIIAGFKRISQSSKKEEKPDKIIMLNAFKILISKVLSS